MTTAAAPLCPHCGAKSVEYHFTFNRALAVFLGRLYEAGVPVRTDALDLTYSQRTNSQKLRYWGLARPHETRETQRKRGWWVIEEKGVAFVEGRITVPRIAVTRRGVVLRLEGAALAFRDVSDGYVYRRAYAAEARQQLHPAPAAEPWLEGLRP